MDVKREHPEDWTGKPLAEYHTGSLNTEHWLFVKSGTAPRKNSIAVSMVNVGKYWRVVVVVVVPGRPGACRHQCHGNLSRGLVVALSVSLCLAPPHPSSPPVSGFASPVSACCFAECICLWYASAKAGRPPHWTTFLG